MSLVQVLISHTHTQTHTNTHTHTGDERRAAMIELAIAGNEHHKQLVVAQRLVCIYRMCSLICKRSYKYI
jgi:nicotinic acid mononucleotide adenylyltransferase